MISFCQDTSLLDNQWGISVRFKHTISKKEFTGYSGDIVTVLAFLFSLWLLLLSDTIRVPKHPMHKINSKSKISTGVHTLWQCSLLTGKIFFLESGLFSGCWGAKRKTLNNICDKYKFCIAWGEGGQGLGTRTWLSTGGVTSCSQAGWLLHHRVPGSPKGVSTASSVNLIWLPLVFLLNSALLFVS